MVKVGNKWQQLLTITNKLVKVGNKWQQILTVTNNLVEVSKKIATAINYY